MSFRPIVCAAAIGGAALLLSGCGPHHVPGHRPLPVPPAPAAPVPTQPAVPSGSASPTGSAAPSSPASASGPRQHHRASPPAVQPTGTLLPPAGATVEPGDGTRVGTATPVPLPSGVPGVPNQPGGFDDTGDGASVQTSGS